MKKLTPNRMRTRSQRGQSLIFVCFFMSVLLGMTSLVVDLGLAWLTRLRMQQAADAAALAAVVNLDNSNLAMAKAREYAGYNTFTHGVNNTNVDIPPPDLSKGTLSVTIQQPFTTLFMSFLGIRTLNIGATATARFRTLLPLSVNSNVAPGAGTSQTLSVWGPYSAFSNGDPYSPRFLPGGGINPNHIAGGFNFTVKFPANYLTQTNQNFASIAVFDPDIYQTSGNSSSNTEYEEIQNPPTGVTLPAGTTTRGSTKFTLYKPDNTPTNLSDDVVLADFTADGNNNIVTVRQNINGTMTNVNTGTRPNGHWVSMYNVNVAALGVGPYRINVLPVSGSSENGFDLVAVPPTFINQNNAANLTAATFNPNNTIRFNNLNAGAAGNNNALWTNTSGAVYASGYLPINFRTNNNVSVPLGELPATNANLNIHIIKFDTDVGTNANSVHYYDSAGRIVGTLGTVAANNSFANDNLTITGPYVGGSIRAEYDAATNDTSVWSSYLDGYLAGNPGRPQLVD